MRAIQFVAIALLISPSFAAPVQSPPTPDAAAKQWLLYVDGGDYATGWSRASETFKAQITAQVLQSKIAPVREPLGAIMQRALFKITYSSTAPGLPDGKYAAVQFSSRFANKPEAGETVWLDMENDRWAVIAYFIGPDASKTVTPPVTRQVQSQPAADTGSATGTLICSHEEQVQARIARMNGYTGGPKCSLPE